MTSTALWLEGGDLVSDARSRGIKEHRGVPVVIRYTNQGEHDTTLLQELRNHLTQPLEGGGHGAPLSDALRDALSLGMRAAELFGPPCSKCGSPHLDDRTCGFPVAVS